MHDPTNQTTEAPRAVEPHASILAAHLAQRDEPCPSCNYNLRGLTGDTCPECRLKLCLGVQIHEPRTGWIIAGAMGSMLSAAPALVFVSLVVIVSLYEQRFPRQQREQVMFIFAPAVITLIMGAVTLWFASANGRRRFRALGRARARRIVALCWVCSVAVIVVWSTVMTRMK